MPHTIAQSFERLPRTNDSIAQWERLPKPDDTAPEYHQSAEPRDAVQFAGGAIELRAPHDWWVEQVPFGREVRLVMAPQRPRNIRRMPNDGMWLAYHAAPLSGIQSEEALSREFVALLRSASENDGRYSSPFRFQFREWPAAFAEFTANDPTSASSLITGRHVLVRTDWGIFEFHASAPDEISESRNNIWTATWESLRLNRPASANDVSQYGAAEPYRILGDWKSYRSQMHFGNDGRVVIVADSSLENRNSSPLTGTFEARDDLVFVRWDDGSRLNFRWRLEGNDLFLTDHEGQISHLKRVFN